MKILLCVPEYPPYHIGGGGEVYKNLAEYYHDQGNQVVVVYGFYPSHLFEKIKSYAKSGIKFYRVPEIPYPKCKPYLRTAMPISLVSFLELNKIINKEKPDVAHIHGFGIIFINLVAYLLTKHSIPYIFTIHGYPETPTHKGKLLNLLWGVYLKTIMNSTLKCAKQITCVSKYIRDDYRNTFKNKSIVIYNGINLSDYINLKRTIDVRKRHNLSADTLLIFSLGRIAKMKGFQLVIDRLNIFLKRGLNIKYIIAGEDDGYKSFLNTLISKHGLENYVEFVGFLDFQTKNQYISQCDLFAIPSLWEPFGLVALEGIYFKKPILTTRAGGLKEVLKNYPLTIDIYSSHLIEDINETKNIKSNFSFSLFDWNIITKRYLTELKRIK